ncbi:MAG: nucleotidyl transferase AbiEii/AbiGii toxin family protein [Pseudomonadota bacterium]
MKVAPLKSWQGYADKSFTMNVIANKTISKFLAAILIITFVFPYQTLSAKQTDPAQQYNTQFEKHYNDFIKRFRGLNLENPTTVSRFTADISKYIKEQVDSNGYKNVYGTANEQKWINLGVLQMDIIRYCDMVKDSLGYSSKIQPIRSAQTKDFQLYLETAYRTPDELNQKYPGINNYISKNGVTKEATITLGEVSEIHINKLGLTFTGVNANNDSLIIQNGVLVPTGGGFETGFIASRPGKWDNIAEILKDYKDYSDKFSTTFPIRLQEDFSEFVKKEKYPDMPKYREAIFQGVKKFNRDTSVALRKKFNNTMVLQQLYEELYFKALENTLRIYMSNMYIYKNEEYSKNKDYTFAIFACPLMDERNSDATSYKTARYAQYRCLKKMKAVVNDQMRSFREHPDIFKKAFVADIKENMNKFVIPGIIQARKELAADLYIKNSDPVDVGVSTGDIYHKQKYAFLTEQQADTFKDKKEKAKGVYYAKLNQLANQYKEARFLFADEDLRKEYFGDPISSRSEVRAYGSGDSPYYHNPTPYRSQLTFNAIHTKVSQDQIWKAFDLSQQTLKEYTRELNKTYQNVMDDHLTQKYAQLYIDQKGQDLLKSQGLFKPAFNNGCCENEEMDRIENYALDGIISINIEVPSTRELYREKPEYTKMLGTIDSYIKSQEQELLRQQSVRNTIAVVGAVAGTVLLFTGIGSIVGTYLLGITSATLAAFELAAGAVFTLTMTAETISSIEEHSKIKKEIKELVTAKSGNQDIDLSYLNDLTEKESAALKGAITNGFFAVLGMVGGVAGLKGLLGFSKAEELGKWMANFSKQLESDPSFSSAMKTLQTNLSVGNDASKFNLFVRYAQKAGLSTDDMKALSYKIKPNDTELTFLNKKLSKTGTQEFNEWHNSNKVGKGKTEVPEVNKTIPVQKVAQNKKTDIETKINELAKARSAPGYITSTKAKTLIERETVLTRVLYKILKYKDSLILKGGFVCKKCYLSTRFTSDVDLLLKIPNELKNMPIKQITESQYFKTVQQDIITLIQAPDDSEIWFYYLGSKNIGYAQRDYFAYGFGKKPVIVNKSYSRRMSIDIAPDVENPSPSIILNGITDNIGDLNFNFYTYTRERVVAEKIETLFRRGTENTRSRDIFDIYTQIDWCDKAALKNELKNVFAARRLQEHNITTLNELENMDPRLLQQGWKKTLAESTWPEADFNMMYQAVIKDLENYNIDAIIKEAGVVKKAATPKAVSPKASNAGGGLFSEGSEEVKETIRGLDNIAEKHPEYLESYLEYDLPKVRAKLKPEDQAILDKKTEALTKTITARKEQGVKFGAILESDVELNNSLKGIMYRENLVQTYYEIATNVKNETELNSLANILKRLSKYDKIKRRIKIILNRSSDRDLVDDITRLGEDYPIGATISKEYTIEEELKILKSDREILNTPNGFVNEKNPITLRELSAYNRYPGDGDVVNPEDLCSVVPTPNLPAARSCMEKNVFTHVSRLASDESVILGIDGSKLSLNNQKRVQQLIEQRTNWISSVDLSYGPGSSISIEVKASDLGVKSIQDARVYDIQKLMLDRVNQVFEYQPKIKPRP